MLLQETIFANPWIPDDINLSVSRKTYRYDQAELQIYSQVDSAIRLQDMALDELLTAEAKRAIGADNIRSLGALHYLDTHLPKNSIDVSLEVREDDESSIGTSFSLVNFENFPSEGSVIRNSHGNWINFFKKYIVFSGIGRTISTVPHFTFGDNYQSFGTRIVYGKVGKMSHLNSFHTFGVNLYRSYYKNSGQSFMCEINMNFGIELEGMQIVLEQGYDIKDGSLYKKHSGTHFIYTPEVKSYNQSNLSLSLNIFSEMRYNILTSSGISIAIEIKT